tara:strand:+ start:537 stop:1082 length:546 start_codon:yes stop_codon:yes gene_type:complete
MNRENAKAVSRSSLLSTGVSVLSDKGKPIMTVTQATDHIRTVASDNLIIIDEWGDSGAEALRYPKDLQRAYGLLGEIHLPSFPLQTWRGYATALHELGHFLDPKQLPNLDQDINASILGQRDLFSDNRITSELGAWQWARANALVWNQEMDDIRNHCLLSYADASRLAGFGVEIRRAGDSR